MTRPPFPRRPRATSGQQAPEGLPSPRRPLPGPPVAPEPPASHEEPEEEVALDLDAPGPDGTGAADEDVREWVELAQAGDAEAFGRLYDRYVDTVYRYVYYRVASRTLAEDLTSETFLRALRRIDSFTWTGRDVVAWFLTIARNLITDHYKSSRYKLELTVDDLLEAGADRPTAGPEGQVLAALTHEALFEAVRSLNAEQQECVVLRFLQGLSVAETAEVMGKNEGSVKALQYRAVRALARVLPEDLTR